MAYFSGSFYSPALKFNTHMNIFLPGDDKEGMFAAYAPLPPKVLVALHGISGNADSWPTMTSICRYAQEYNIAVFMVEAPRSFYTDMAFGPAYATYIARDLPAMIESTFRLDTSRKNMCISGLSMGGFGACMLALAYPDVFGSCTAFSFGDATEGKIRAATRKDLMASFGASAPEGEFAPEHRIGSLAGKVAAMPEEERPQMYFACGTEDPLYKMYLGVLETLEGAGLGFRHEEWPGIHNYDFWDAAIRRAMQLLRDGWEE